MEQIKEFGKCYYQSSFFNMKIDLPLDLTNLNQIPEGAWGLYYHEYIHYIQDITAIYGLMNISTANFYIQYCASKIAKSNSKDFNVPIYISDIKDDIGNDLGVLNLELKPIYLGSEINPKSKLVTNLNLTIQNYTASNGYNIPIVVVEFIDEFDNHRKIDFGGNILSEGMAYIAEQYNFNGIINKADEYPYSIVEKIIDFYYPEIVEDKILIFAICDISLMTYHPGHNFIRLLDYLKEKKINSPIEDYDIFYNECLKIIKGSHPDFNQIADIVKNEILKNFNADYFLDTKNWINTLFENVKILRSQLPSFAIDLVRFGKPLENEFFQKTFGVLGSPMTLDCDGNGTISLPRNFSPQTDYFNPSIFMAINQILRIFYQDKPSCCKLINYCKQSINEQNHIEINKNCYESPWKKAQENNLCPVGQMWHHWALKDYSPKYK